MDHWAVEIPGVAPFAGFVGLAIPRFEAIFTPCVEIGWRLAAEYWGRGYATEGARAALAFGFGPLGLAEIVSYTVPANLRSRRVMEKIGMTHRPPTTSTTRCCLPDTRLAGTCSTGLPGNIRTRRPNHWEPNIPFLPGALRPWPNSKSSPRKG